MQNYYLEEQYMKDDIEDIIDVGCLEIELLFIEWEYKINQLFINTREK